MFWCWYSKDQNYYLGAASCQAFESGSRRSKKAGGREQLISQTSWCYEFCRRSLRLVVAVLGAAGPGGCAVCTAPRARQSEIHDQPALFYQQHQPPKDLRVLGTVILPGM